MATHRGTAPSKRIGRHVPVKQVHHRTPRMWKLMQDAIPFLADQIQPAPNNSVCVEKAQNNTKRVITWEVAARAN